MATVLVLGASGATGRLLVQQLLQKDIKVIAVVRDLNSFTQVVGTHPDLLAVEADILDIPDNILVTYLQECSAVISCLGHNLTFKGMFGRPKLLVTDVAKKITRVLESMASDVKIKYILMNTTGNSNRDIPEKPPLSQRFVISLIRLLLPPHVDNEKAADFLRLHVGQKHKYIEWSAVRPDSLTNEDVVTEYDIHSSPIRNVIFDAASTSRINVANFMLNLVTDDDLWAKWKGKMPVIYNHV